MHSADLIGPWFIQKVSKSFRSEGVGQKYEKVLHKRRGSKQESYTTPLDYVVSKIGFELLQMSLYHHWMSYLV